MSGHTIHPRMLARANGCLKRKLLTFESARRTTLESLDTILNALHKLCAMPWCEFAVKFIHEFETERQKLLALDPFQATDRRTATKIARRLEVLCDGFYARAGDGDTTNSASRDGMLG